MNEKFIPFEELSFKSMGDLKWHIANGCEIEFVWKGKGYSITHPDGKICIGEGYYLKGQKAYNVLSHTEHDVSQSLISDDVDEIMEYTLGEDKLRDIASEIGVVYRSL